MQFTRAVQNAGRIGMRGMRGMRGVPMMRRSYATSLGIVNDTPTLNTQKYGGVYTVTLIPGDGVGSEITGAVEEIFDYLDVPVEFERYNVSGYTGEGEQLYQNALSSLRRNKVGLKGILYTPLERTGHKSWNVALRQELDIFAAISVCRSLPGLPTRHNNVDLTIIRENTEGEYSGLEHQSVPGIVESLKIITRAKSERIHRFAFDFAVKNNRKKVTVVHKANIMKLGDGLFLNTFRDVAKEYEPLGIKSEAMIVDNTSMQLVSKPNQFDVLVMPNLYGSITSNIGAGLVGGPGIVPGANIGRDYALFEPGCRHVAKDIQGKEVANPVAMVLSSAMMLRHLGLNNYANLIHKATEQVIADAKIRTPDIGGTNHTGDVVKAIIENINKLK